MSPVSQTSGLISVKIGTAASVLRALARKPLPAGAGGLPLQGHEVGAQDAPRLQGESPRAAHSPLHSLPSVRSPNFLYTLFTIYSNSVILNKNSVSYARMIDYCTVTRSPPRDRLGAGGAV